MDDEQSRPKSHVDTNDLPLLEIDNEKSSNPPPPPQSTKPTWRVKLSKYWAFAAHLTLVALVSMTCLHFLDGRAFNVNSHRAQYQEVDGSFSTATSYVPLQSDITTVVSVAATVTRSVGSLWATGYIWRCIFVAMERGGISAKGVSRVISSWLPARHHFTRTSDLFIIYIALIALFATNYFSAALTGSFIWESAVTRVPGKMPLSGIADGSLLRVINMTNEEYIDTLLGSLVNRGSQVITMASTSASVAWRTPQSNSILNTAEPSTTFRRVLNGAQYISTNSTLTKVPMPYFAVKAFEWVRDPHQVLTHKQLSLLNQNASRYNNPFIIRENGTGGLLPDEEWGKGPKASPSGSGGLAMAISETRLFTFRIWFPWSVPSNQPATMAPPCPQNFTIDPGSEVNFISGPNYPDGRDCFAIANVSYLAGVTSFEDCNIIAPSVAEAQAPFRPPVITGQYTSDALGLTPVIAATFFLSNYAIPLNYGTRRNFSIELTSRAYQASWAAMTDSSAVAANTTTVQIALPTLRAKITHWRVYLWVALHLGVLALGLLFKYFQSHCNHPWVEDPTMAVFWLDTRAVLQTQSDGQLFWDPWQPGTEIPSHEDGMLVLEQNEAGQRSVQVKRSSGSRKRSVQIERSRGLRQRKYSGSMPLRRRMPPSSSMILEEGRESVETLIGTPVPTTVHTNSSHSTRIPENSAE